MKRLRYNLNHLKADVQLIHDNLVHLNSHSKVCNELVKESNIREASELFDHLEQIDKLVHEVKKHIVHIRNHIPKDTSDEADSEHLDIDDLKHDAMHISNDFKDIHTHIEHLITHADMCRDILAPSAEEEFMEIKQHLLEIDENAHELLDHINEIRGQISSKFSEYIWLLPDGIDEYLKETQLIDHGDSGVREMALRLVDRAESIQMAVATILCFTRDFIVPSILEENYQTPASQTLKTRAGGGCAKTILACALARAVNIPSKIHFGRVSYESLIKNFEMVTEAPIEANDDKISIAWPEFLIENIWVDPKVSFDQIPDVTCLHDRFIELGIPRPDIEIKPGHWQDLPKVELEDDGTYPDPAEYFVSSKYSSPTANLERRIFGGFIYLGELSI